MIRIKVTYSVDWYNGDYCYRTTTNVDWDGVKRFKKIAKALGETIKYYKE